MVNQRVRDWFEVQKKKGNLQKDFALKWGLSKQRISQFANGSGSVGLEPVIKILDFDEEINARWLILGEGKMYEPLKLETEPSKKKKSRTAHEMDALVLGEKPVKYQTNTGLIETAQKALESLIDTTYELEEVKGVLAECERENNELKAKLTKPTQGK